VLLNLDFQSYPVVAADGKHDEDDHSDDRKEQDDVCLHDSITTFLFAFRQ